MKYKLTGEEWVEADSVDQFLEENTNQNEHDGEYFVDEEGTEMQVIYYISCTYGIKSK